MLRQRLIIAFSALTIFVTLWWVYVNLVSFAQTGAVASTWGEIANVSIVWLLLAIDMRSKKRA